jgi:hypothetical protein
MSHLTIRILASFAVLFTAPSLSATAAARSESESRTLTETRAFADPGAAHGVEAPRELERSPPRRRDGHFVYEKGRSFGVRVADGGPELSFDTLNGNIYVRRAQR